MSTPILLSAILAAIGGAATLIAKAIRWGSKQIALTYQRSVDALIENTRSNTRVETLVLSIRNDFRAQLRRLERERDRGEGDPPERERAERSARSQTQPRLDAVQPAEEDREVKDTKKRRAHTERGAAKHREKDSDES